MKRLLSMFGSYRRPPQPRHQARFVVLRYPLRRSIAQSSSKKKLFLLRNQVSQR
jgi:hypothetical protein